VLDNKAIKQLILAVFSKHHLKKDLWRNGVIPPSISNLLIPDRHGWSASRSARFRLGERISMWVCPKCNNNIKGDYLTLVRGQNNMNNNNENSNNHNWEKGHIMKFGVPLTTNSKRINRERKRNETYENAST
jgi:hypothetical protein